MSRSGSGYEDGDSALSNGEDGGWLTISDSCIPPSISVLAYRRSDSDNIDGRRFHSLFLHGELLELRDRNCIWGDKAVSEWIRR